ncbi:MAG: TlpA disulfide reductase family protein [Myxococcota bacterium]|nr:TlpA disulfide reductase family protein [Myxococcota bacterium]
MSAWRGLGGAGRGACVAGGLALLLCTGCWTEAESPDGVAAPAAAAPEFFLPRLDGQEQVSLASVAGKIVILDFWATWCPPCASQVPVLNAFYRENRDAGDVVVYGVSVDQVGVEAIQDWVDEQEVEYPNLVGGDPLSRELGAVGFPALFVIGRDGTLQDSHEGIIEREILDGFLAKQRARGDAG